VIVALIVLLDPNLLVVAQPILYRYGYEQRNARGMYER